MSHFGQDGLLAGFTIFVIRTIKTLNKLRELEFIINYGENEMMNKQEQIEEMAKIIEKAESECYPLIFCKNCKYKEIKGHCCFYNYAEKLEKAGYRQINEVRKVTAREILQAVDDESYGQTSAITRVLRKRYGVEVEE